MSEWVLETQRALAGVSGTIGVSQPLQSQLEGGDAAFCFCHHELELGACTVLSSSQL